MKKKNPADLMQDPFYAQIMFRIETLIHERDEEAKRESDLTLKDTNVKSSIRKAMGMLQGKSPKLDPGPLLDHWIGRIATDLCGLWEVFEKEGNVEQRQYIRALLAVEDSLKTRRELEGHSRGYLDFLKRFIEQCRID
ncbi:MAG: hypothetical protein KAU94_00160 [Verrucomicrobia bacterium]|nr:hypothetical protein [Verrucomicrobiota bacterium]